MSGDREEWDVVRNIRMDAAVVRACKGAEEKGLNPRMMKKLGLEGVVMVRGCEAAAALMWRQGAIIVSQSGKDYLMGFLADFKKSRLGVDNDRLRAELAEMETKGGAEL